MLGAIIGDIVGSTLELSNIIFTIADDLYTSYIINELDLIDTPEKIQCFKRYCEKKNYWIKKETYVQQKIHTRKNYGIERERDIRVWQ